MAGEQRSLEGGDHGVFEPEDAGEEVVPAAEPFDDVVAELVLDGAIAPAGGR